jgi:hypothetical protein
VLETISFLRFPLLKWKIFVFATMSRARTPVLWIFSSLLPLSNFVNAFLFPFTPPLFDGASRNHMEENFQFSKFFHVSLVLVEKIAWDAPLHGSEKLMKTSDMNSNHSIIFFRYQIFIHFHQNQVETSFT